MLLCGLKNQLPPTGQEVKT